MPTVNELLLEEQIDDQYKKLRNTPRDIIINGVRPNAVQCLLAYNNLQIALNGGNEELGIPDISSKLESFTTITAQVTPFITAMQNAMKIVIDSPVVIDQLAALQGISILPFLNIGNGEVVDMNDYVLILVEARNSIDNLITLLTESE